jgi:cytochrome b involved in lipid metabolism
MNNEELTKELQDTIQSAKKVSLSLREKSLMKERISSYMYSTKIPVKTSMSFSSFFSYRSMYLMPALAIVLLISGAGTSYYAQNSLPGDVLYGVKTGVNENVESLFAISPEARAQVDLKQVSTRLDEAEKLSVAGNLTEVQSQAIQANFSKKVESLNKNLDKVKQKGDSKKIAEKVSQDFDREIDEHFNTFVTISNSASNSPTFASIFASKKGRSGGSDDGVIMMSAVRVAAPTSAKSKDIKKEDSDSKHDEDDENEDEDEDEDDDDSRSGVNTQPVKLAQPVATSTQTSTSGVASYTLVQVSVHNTSSDCWSVVSGGVYNLTSWIAKHPGGQSAIKGMCGVDGTVGFLAQHNGDTKAVGTLVAYKIGVLK